MDQCREKIEELLLGVTGGVGRIPTCRQLFVFVPHKDFVKAVLIPKTKRRWWRGGVCAYIRRVLGVDWDMIRDGHHSRFPAAQSLEQQCN